MDSHLNPMVVNAVIWFDEPIDLSRARETVEHRLVGQFPRFRQRVAEPLGRPPRFEDHWSSTSTSTCTGSRCPRQVIAPRSRSS
jgi:hypothetical protein